MTIEFHCSSCNKLLRTSDDRAGARAKCPDCGTAITVPGGKGGDFDLGEYDEYGAEPAAGGGFETAFGDPTHTPGRRSPGVATKACPMCGAEIRAAAVKCRFCGEMLDEPRRGGGRRWQSDEDVRRKVQAPALAMLISFSLTLAILMIGLVFIAVAPGGQRNRAMFPFGGDKAVVLIMGIVQAVICILIIVGSWQMRNLRSYGLAMTGSILSMIPYISPCCLLGLPFGIWSIVVLNDENVKSAFR